MALIGLMRGPLPPYPYHIEQGTETAVWNLTQA